MNKLLRYFAISAFAAVSMTAAAESTEVAKGLTMTWNSGIIDIRDDWGGAKVGANPRFATAYDGKIYTINNETQAIAQVTENGLVDTYTLPALASTDDYYGAAITCDEVGNFLLSLNFVRKVDNENISGTTWAIYSPTTGKMKQFKLKNIANFRIDCVGRVLGDLTKKAYAYIADGSTKQILVVEITGDGTVESTEMEIIDKVDVTSASQASYAQPAYNTLAEAGENIEDFYYVEGVGYRTAFIDDELVDFAPNWCANSAYNAFATFTIDGKRYFAAEATTNPGAREFGLLIMDENGYALASYVDPAYVGSLGYSSIIAYANEDKTATIYVYNCNGNKINGETTIGSEAAIFTFNPAEAGEAEIPAGKEDNPYVIKTVEDLTGLGAALKFSPFFVEFDADIDMKDVDWTPIEGKDVVTTVEGNGHVIKNLSLTNVYAALFKTFNGTIKNLGMENIKNIDDVIYGMASSFVCYSYGETTIENCYATGYAEGSYAGGIAAGVNGGHLTIKNCWANVNVSGEYAAGKSSNVGGICGSCNVNCALTIENCYAAGTVKCGGAITSTNAWGIEHPVDREPYDGVDVTIKNVVALNPSVEGASEESPFVNNKLSFILGGIENAIIWEDAEVNGEAVENGASLLKCQETILGWGTFNKKLNYGYPVLTWQAANGLGLGVEAPTATVSATKDGEGVALTTMYDLEGGKAYVTVAAPEGMKVMYKFVAAAAEAPEAQAGELEEEDNSADYTVADGAIEVAYNGLLYFAVSDGENLGEIACTAFTGGETAGIAEIEVEATANATYYNLQGVRVDNPSNGVFVRVAGGKASKVLVK